MEMKITEKPDFRKKAKDIDLGGGGAGGGNPMHDIMLNIRSRMLDRVQKQNKDIRGKPFQKYSDFTITAKQKLGRKPGVNMTDRGIMLRSVNVKGKKNYGILWLADRKKIGTYHQYGTTKMPKREWFGYSTKNEKETRKEIEKKLNKQIQK